jgi:chemotaxis protein MotB
MGRRRARRGEEEHENHERWLVSYADFITLLFAFFVVMYAISSVNEGKYRVLSDSLGNAFGREGGNLIPALPVNPPSGPLRPNVRKGSRAPATEAAVKREREQMTNMARELLLALSPLVDQGKVRVTQTVRGVTVEISASVLFDSGEANLKLLSVQVLTAVAQVLKDDFHALQVEGHTDIMPIASPIFPSNWELSSARASAVVRLFASNGIAESRLVAVGHGSNQPVASNLTPEGRSSNRRVSLLILSALQDSGTEVPLGAGQ